MWVVSTPGRYTQDGCGTVAGRLQGGVGRTPDTGRRSGKGRQSGLGTAAIMEREARVEE